MLVRVRIHKRSCAQAAGVRVHVRVPGALRVRERVCVCARVHVRARVCGQSLRREAVDTFACFRSWLLKRTSLATKLVHSHWSLRFQAAQASSQLLVAQASSDQRSVVGVVALLTSGTKP